jgi:uncharacterized protein
MTIYELRITKESAAESSRRRVSSFCIATSLLLLATTVLADETPRTGVIDRAGVVDEATEARINAWLLELETKTKAQLKVLTVETTEGRDIYEFGKETFNRWRLGQADKDNGALVVIAVKDKKWRILTGEGIEDTLPDAYCDQVAADFFLPNFRRGDFGKGILEGTAVLAQKIAADEKVQLTGVPVIGSPTGRQSDSTIASFVAVAIMFVFIIMGMLNRNARGRGNRAWGGDWLTWMVIGNMLSGGRRRGGSSWGGFGGFSGGGGFGGGGAGGSW